VPLWKSLWKDVIGKAPIRRHLSIHCVLKLTRLVRKADVGAQRGTANNLAASVGTVVIGALVVGVLSTGVINALTAKLLAFWTRSNTHAECKM
jgi:hypothetical protein